MAASKDKKVPRPKGSTKPAQRKTTQKKAARKKPAPTKQAKGNGAAAPRSAADLEARAVDAALALAQTQDWRDVTLQAIAEEAGVPFADLAEKFTGKTAILSRLMRRIDRQVLEGLDPDLAGEPARERLLDVLISRFEALAPHKQAIANISRAVAADPGLALALRRSALRSQLAMLAAAGIETDGPLGLLRAQGLALVFLRALRRWLDDDDPGMAATMAMLDRSLRDGERIIRRLQLAADAVDLARGFAIALMNRRREAPERETTV